MSCLGMENASGDFEVVDICFAGLPPLAPLASARPVKALQTDTKQNIGKGKGKARQVDSDMNMDEDTTMDVESKPSVDGEPVWVALISGLSAGSSEVPEDLKGQLMAEWLMGELGGVDVSTGAPMERTSC
jgi:DNA polymerase delta subunit 2